MRPSSVGPSAEGEGFAGQQARQGWLLLLNILFRPVLLVIGLFLSMIMMYVISKITVMGFSVYSGTIIMTTGWGLVSIFSFLFLNIIFIGMIIMLSHKAHEMIYETADNVMRWIGSHVKPLGEAQGEQGTHRMYGVAAAYVGQGGSAIAGKASTPGGAAPVAGAPKTGGSDGSSGGGATTGARGYDVVNGGSEAKGRSTSLNQND